MYYKHLEAGCRAPAGVRPLHFDPPLYRWFNRASDEAFEQVEQVYAERFATNRVIRHLCRLFQSDVIHLAFKKILVEQLSGVFYYRILIDRVREQCRGVGSVAFILSTRRGPPRG